jgi:hypothetical protein
MRGFSESGVVARAFDTASTLEVSFALVFDASFDGSLCWLGGCPLPEYLEDCAGSLR